MQMIWDAIFIIFKCSNIILKFSDLSVENTQKNESYLKIDYDCECKTFSCYILDLHFQFLT